MNDLTKMGSFARGNFDISDIHDIIDLVTFDIIMNRISYHFESYDQFPS